MSSRTRIPGQRWFDTELEPWPMPAYRELATVPNVEQRVLFCPRCGGQHIDSGEWATVEKAHRTHRCAWCLEEWRPEKVATVGIPIPPRVFDLNVEWADHKMETERRWQRDAWLAARLAQFDESVRMREMMPDSGAGLAETVANSRLFRR